MPVAFDTETELFGPGNRAPSLVCLSWSDTPGQEKIIHAKEAYDVARALVVNATATDPLVGHRVAFDLCVLARHFPDLMPLIFEAYERGAISDTYIRQRLIDIAYGHERKSCSLQSLAEYYLREVLEKDNWRLRYAELKDTPIDQWPEEAVQYSKTDARVTLQIYQAQQNIAGRDACLLSDEAAQCRADFALLLAANRGLRTEIKSVTEFASRIRAEFEETRQVLLQGGLLKQTKKKGELVYVRDTKTAASRLLAASDPYSLARTPKGAIQIDEESCEASNDPLLISYSRYTKLQTLLSKDCEILERGTREPIHTSFNVLMNTGRTSSSNPNMQNPRREPGVRECFVPRDGFVFASADYEAAELHTLAQFCKHFFGYSALANILNGGIDPHLAFAAQLMRIPYQEALELKKVGDARVAETRQMAKAANFGFPGGMGPITFRKYAKGYGFDLNLNDARDLRKKWLDTFPEMRKYFDYISRVVGPGKTGNICHLYTNRRRGQVHYTAACNSFFQGLAADGAKRALFEVQRHCQVKKDSALFGSHVVNFLHDEIMLEVPEAQGHAAAHELAKIMVREFNHFVPDVPVRASPQLMRCWSKNAKPIYDTQGRLIPWQPKEQA